MKTRMLKAQCGTCAYTVRIARSWLREVGPPLCPSGHGVLKCPQWDEIIEAELVEWEQEARAEAERRHRLHVLKDGYVTTRKPHTCHKCRETIQHPDRMRHRVYSSTADGLFSEYTCLRCDDAASRNPLGLQGALARA